MHLFCFKSKGSYAWSFAVMAESEEAARTAVDTFLQSEELDPSDWHNYEVYGWSDENYTMSVYEVGQVAHFSTRQEVE